MQEFPNCLACAKAVSNTDIPYNDIGLSHYELFDDLSLSYCSHYGFGFAVPELSEEALNSFYENQYRDKSSSYYVDYSKQPANYPKIRKSRSFFQILLGRIFCDFDSGDNFLNIGSGDGGSFRVANSILNNPSLHSIEKSLDDLTNSVSLSSNIKSIIKRIFNLSPQWIKNMVRFTERVLNAPSNFYAKRFTNKTLGKLPAHSYGGNRVALRVIARKIS